MTDKEYKIEMLRERISYLRNLYNKLEFSNAPKRKLGMVVTKIQELKERLRKLER